MPAQTWSLISPRSPPSVGTGFTQYTPGMRATSRRRAPEISKPAVSKVRFSTSRPVLRPPRSAIARTTASVSTPRYTRTVTFSGASGR
ncbi:MAG: hypothetical protein ACYTAQ_17305, partial [Planctomycetota bacterium]